MFIVAMVIVTFGEMFVWPAVPTIASQLSPKGREGFYQGIVNSFATMGRMFGPFFGGVLADQYGMQVMLFILTAFMIFQLSPVWYTTGQLKKRDINRKVVHRLSGFYIRETKLAIDLLNTFIATFDRV